MKKILYLILLLPSLCFGQLKISQLTDNPTITGAEVFPLAKSGLNYKENLDTLKTWILSGGFLKTDGSTAGATSQPQSLEQGAYTQSSDWDGFSIGQQITWDNFAQFNIFDFTNRKIIQCNGAAGLVTVTDIDSTTSVVLNADGSISQTCIDSGVVSTVVTRHIKKTLSADQVKNAFSSPVDIIPAPGGGRTIRVTGGYIKLNFNSEAFDISDAYLKINGATDPQWRVRGVLTSSSDQRVAFSPNNSISGGDLSDMSDDRGLQFTTNQDSVTGDSTITLYIDYVITSE